MSGNDDQCSNTEEGWREKRLEIIYDQTTKVIEYQYQDLSDIDDKAMRTVRIELIAFGILISGFQLAQPQLNTTYLFLGGMFLLLSLCFGILTYSESDVYYGPNKKYLKQLISNNFEDKSWDIDLLETQTEWIEQNYKDIKWNGILLFISQILLVISILLFTAAVLF